MLWVKKRSGILKKEQVLHILKTFTVSIFNGKNCKFYSQPNHGFSMAAFTPGMCEGGE